MPLEIKKTDRETNQSLIRRFSRGVQESGILVRARKTRFKAGKKSHLAKKTAALRKVVLRKEYEKMRKLGKV